MEYQHFFLALRIQRRQRANRDALLFFRSLRQNLNRSRLIRLYADQNLFDLHDFLNHCSAGDNLLSIFKHLPQIRREEAFTFRTVQD